MKKFLPAAAFLLAAGGAGAGELVLVREGVPASVIIIAADADPDEELAAREIQEHLRLMTGAAPAVESAAPGEIPGLAARRRAAGLTPLLLGTAGGDEATSDRLRRRAAAALDSFLCQEKYPPPAFLLARGPDQARLVGLTPEGTLFAAYEMLEQLGVRWFMPGEIGRVVPETPTAALPAGETLQVPSFEARLLTRSDYGGDTLWPRRTRQGGWMPPHGHGIAPIRTGHRRRYFDRDPEMFALIDGRRQPRQLNLAHPEVFRLSLEAAVDHLRQVPGDQPRWLSMSAEDGAGHCESPESTALDGDFDPYWNEPSVTDRFIGFINRVLGELEEEFPDAFIGTLVYRNHLRLPVRHRPHRNIIAVMAPIGVCRRHGIGNPVCPERYYYGQLIEQWRDSGVAAVYERGWLANLADPGLPFPWVEALRTEVPRKHALGVRGFRTVLHPHWGSLTPAPYVAARLYWDVNTCVDQLLADFYTRFFGPAAAPMGRYLARLEKAQRDSDRHTGGAFNTPQVFDQQVMAAGGADLDRAAALAAAEPYASRVAMFRLMYDYLAAFIEMVERRNRHDYQGAFDALGRFRGLMQQAAAHDPPLVYERFAESFTRRFWAPAIEEGHARTSGGNRLVAGLPDTWLMRLDYHGTGSDLGYHRPELAGGNWRAVRTLGASQGDQGDRYHFEDTWYRTLVSVPGEFAGQPLRLWFGGVNATAAIWVNGEPVGESEAGVFHPFEFDVTDHIRPGARNLVAVRTSRGGRPREFGLGGISYPVMIYSPAAATGE